MYKMFCLVALGVIGSISLSSSYGIQRYPSNRMLDFNWPEPDEHIIRFPHERYCHYYYKREAHELFTIRKCPPGEMFDYHRHECKEKHSAQCWSHHYGKHAVHDHIHSKWRKHFKCPFPNGNYPDIFDCEKYIVCLDGKPHHKHCAPNHQFDKNRRHCLYAAVCANSTDAALLTHMCPYSSGKFSHLEDCSKYYNCHKSEPTVKTCQNDELFDEDDRECKARELVDCKDRPDPYRKISITKLIPEALTTDVHSSSISPVNTKNNVAYTKTVESNQRSVATSNSVTSDKTSVMEGKVTTTKSIMETKTTGNLYSSTSPNGDQAVAQSGETDDSHSSMPSTHAAMESTVESGATNNSNSSMPSSHAAMESTVDPGATDNSNSSMPSSYIATESTAQPGATDDSQSSMPSSNITAESTVQDKATDNSHSPSSANVTLAQLTTAHH